MFIKTCKSPTLLGNHFWLSSGEFLKATAAGTGSQGSSEGTGRLCHSPNHSQPPAPAALLTRPLWDPTDSCICS